MNFDSLINDEEDDYYIGDDSEREGDGQLNPITEDAQEESVSPHPKDKH